MGFCAFLLGEVGWLVKNFGWEVAFFNALRIAIKRKEQEQRAMDPSSFDHPYPKIRNIVNSSWDASKDQRFRIEIEWAQLTWHVQLSLNVEILPAEAIASKSLAILWSFATPSWWAGKLKRHLGTPPIKIDTWWKDHLKKMEIHWRWRFWKKIWHNSN